LEEADRRADDFGFTIDVNQHRAGAPQGSTATTLMANGWRSWMRAARQENPALDIGCQRHRSATLRFLRR
jgi:hypothetical protein